MRGVAGSEIRECTHSFINNTSSAEAYVVHNEHLPTVRSSAEFAREDDGSPATTFGRKSSVHELKEKHNRESAKFNNTYTNPTPTDEAYVRILQKDLIKTKQLLKDSLRAESENLSLTEKYGNLKEDYE